MNAQVEFISETKVTPDNKANKKKRSKPKFTKQPPKPVDTSMAVIVHGDIKFVYDQIKIVSRNIKETPLKVADFVVDTSVEPGNLSEFIDNAILRVVMYNGKLHILSGKNKYREAATTGEETVGGHLVPVLAINRTVLIESATIKKIVSPQKKKAEPPAKFLSTKEIAEKLASSGLKVITGGVKNK